VLAVTDCKWCGLPVTELHPGDPMRDGTRATARWYHYDLVFETEAGVECADNPGRTATPYTGPTRWQRIVAPFRSRRAASTMQATNAC